MSGGNLKFHLDKIKQFSEIQVKFYSAQIISGLSYLHKKDSKLKNSLSFKF